ncbi:glucans biosynthesis glucosyltransferase MdoH [Rhodoligotrophos appendicifer]|uniref:glucans biosynthesis glucosyltransferase MdoH n=1 Tax=Rhodoligotrophos appendicifer TaxID=987056 RepID=UPI001184C0CE|nr:glucans biosynthesis glucosyltransferase MdoH [Rhodoligotrophos appendicifer]
MNCPAPQSDFRSPSNPLQLPEHVRWRRLIMATLVAVTFLLLVVSVGYLLAGDGWSALDFVLFASISAAAPWTIMGFWNATIGLWLLHAVQDWRPIVSPFLSLAGPLHKQSRIAILMTLRNEDPRSAIDRLRVINHSIQQTGYGDLFKYFILSDTSDIAIAEEEEIYTKDVSSDFGSDNLVYRRRMQNTGFKSGNISDFLDRWGHDFEFMIPLDADSLMTGECIIRLVRTMQQNRQIGIMQTLVVGAPAQTAFARIFQFGMRAGMRAYTMGSAWWTADCGQYWGHNALIRVAAFSDHCRLSPLPGGPPLGGHLLSHDLVEAVLMRRGGYEVRVIPEECGSYEDNPPTLSEYMRRETRWCQGNMQYFRLLTLPGLNPVSRLNLLSAIIMYSSSLFWLIMILSALSKLIWGELDHLNADIGVTIYIVMLTMSLWPKLAGFADIYLSRKSKMYGGPFVLIRNASIEIFFSMILAPIISLRISTFLISLFFGNSITWNAQIRSAHKINVRTAFAQLWPQTVSGLIFCLCLAALAPMVLIWAAPTLVGLCLAVPIAVITASSALGAATRRHMICNIPEDLQMPYELERLKLTRAGIPVLPISEDDLAQKRPTASSDA